MEIVPKTSSLPISNDGCTKHNFDSVDKDTVKINNDMKSIGKNSNSEWLVLLFFFVKYKKFKGYTFIIKILF